MTARKGLSPLVSLATSMHSQPGVYSVLLGSGVSTGAGLLTGWGVVRELVARAAAAASPDDENAVAAARADPEAWWAQHGDGELGYASLLEQLAPSAAARQGLLAGFFEPTADEDTSPRQPSKAHRAIAELVRRGSVKVIVTTNFDRLMEQALDAVGISPQVISRPEAVNGMAPLAHAKVTLLKLHGDYLDLGTRNTPTELSEYPAEWTDLLQQVFDEYGLIVSGWSADWDIALVRALEESTSRRYPLFWDQRSSRGEAATRLVAGRGGIVLPASSADDLFTELLESLEALDRLSAPPLTTAMAIARLKRYLPDPVRRIDLHDLVMGIVDDVVAAIADSPQRVPDSGQFTFEMLDSIIDGHLHSMDQLAPMLIEGVRHDPEGTHDQLWVDVIQRLIDAATAYPSSYVPALHSLRRLPAFVALAVVSITATRRNREGLLLTVVSDVEAQSRPGGGEARDAAETLHYLRLAESDHVKQLPRWGGTRWLYPTSHLLKTEVRRFFTELIPADDDFDVAYHGFEYRLSLLQQNLPDGGLYRHNAMSGEFIGETAWYGKQLLPETDFRRTIERGHAASWVSFFGTPEAMETALANQTEILKGYRRYF